MVSATGATIPDASDGDALKLPNSWSVSSLTFSFPGSASAYAPGDAPYGETGDFLTLSSGGKDMVRDALGSWADVVPLTFVEKTGSAAAGADLRIAGTGVASTAWAYPPGFNTAAEGDVWIGVDKSYNALFLRDTQPYVGSYEYYVAMHEFGHSLGFKHPHQAYGTATEIMDQAVDAIEYTIMSYRSYVGGPVSALTPDKGHFPQSLMMLDIFAMQDIYGANYATEAGNTVYSFAPNSGSMQVNGVQGDATVANVVFRTLWDGGGKDLIDLSAYSTDVVADLTPGAGIQFDSSGGLAQRAMLSQSANAYAQYNLYMSLLHQGDTRSLIENLTTGSGDDLLQGNAGDNELIAGAGADTLSGGLGDDTLTGGAGADMFRGTLSAFDGDTITDLDPTLDRMVILNAVAGDLSFSASGTTGAISIFSQGGLAATVLLSLPTNYSVTGATDTSEGVELVFSQQTPPPPPPPTAGSYYGTVYPVLSGNYQDNSITPDNGSFLVEAQGGDDRIRIGEGDDVVVTGLGADRVIVDLRDPGSGIDLVTDLDFAAGDWLAIYTQQSGLFENSFNSTNSYWSGSSGEQAFVRSFADLEEVVASAGVSAADGAYGLVLTFDAVSTTYQLELAGFSTSMLDPAALSQPITPPDAAGHYAGLGYRQVTASGNSETLSMRTDATVYEGLDGADRFNWDMRNFTGTSNEAILDLDFSEGDWISVLTSAPGTFDQAALDGSGIWQGSQDEMLHIRSLDALSTVISVGALSARDGTYGLEISVPVAGFDRTLELVGIWTSDLP